ncbi:uncharacterized protein [Nicotiana tomentosiformis]|uniref:uncharacterized protein n=1 Tax=Nicotiana tomentosiformis TaxID=4098 RepID=UPI00388C935B
MFDGPLVIYLGPRDTEYVLREVHEGTCENHSGAESLVQKVIRAGYYWIDIEKDAKEFVRKYGKCQRHAPIIHQLGEPLHSVLSQWPFMKWEWTSLALFHEHQAFEKVREKEVIDFIWDHIICRFRLPFEIVCDNEKQFIGSKVTKFLEDHKIKRILSTPYHTSGNVKA